MTKTAPLAPKPKRPKQVPLTFSKTDRFEFKRNPPNPSYNRSSHPRHAAVPRGVHGLGAGVADQEFQDIDVPAVRGDVHRGHA